MDTVANSVEKMKRLLFQLRGGYTLGPPTPIALGEVLRQVVAAKASLKPAPRLEPAAGALSVVAHGARLERVIGHLVQNAIEATHSGGDVVVGLMVQAALSAQASAVRYWHEGVQVMPMTSHSVDEHA